MLLDTNNCSFERRQEVAGQASEANDSGSAEPSADRKFRKELSAGTVSLALLGIMEYTGEPMYGYQIAKLMEADDGKGSSLIKHGAIYPVLRSLESAGLLESRVEPSVSGPPRRYYSITEEGENALRRWTDIWRRTSSFIDRVLGGSIDDQNN
ncbi:MAG: PadR family transcriptional regulator [Candidatus Aegiribacteria sp.]|nr:PadR family transcriptional regulator [Candidatus Aegiribacteria sp.]MBD3294337.1 PadR family transcriptional regulator [Candidatus Fermentibacteria bacterium]